MLAHACICMHMHAYACLHIKAYACTYMHMHAYACTQPAPYPNHRGGAESTPECPKVSADAYKPVLKHPGEPRGPPADHPRDLGGPREVPGGAPGDPWWSPGRLRGVPRDVPGGPQDLQKDHGGLMGPGDLGGLTSAQPQSIEKRLPLRPHLKTKL